jgi:hypothetical protein
MRWISLSGVFAGLLVLGQSQEPLPLPSTWTRSFSRWGYDWIVKDSGGARVGPGNNYFSAHSVELVPGGVKLKVAERAGRFECAEIVSRRSFGYGTYRFTIASNVDDLAANLVLGLFTWSDAPEFHHREIDIEIGRWGDPDNQNLQFVVQPYTRPQNMVRFTLPEGLGQTVHSFEWRPDRIRFRSEAPAASRRSRVIRELVMSSGIPQTGGEQARVNLWNMSSRPPAPGATEIVLSKFEFTPLR